jgi:methylation protein EvaC
MSASTARKACAGCGSTRLHDFLDLGSSPLADRFPAAGDDEEWLPLRVAACEACRLVQLRDVADDADLFGADYGFLTGASPALAAYYAGWAEWALREHGGQARAGVIEIACNDGTLLAHFAAAGCPVLGIEPAGPPARAAEAAGLAVLRAPFTAALAAGSGIAPAGLVIANNVAAHVADPLDFLTGIRSLLAPRGVAVIEFQYLGDLLAGCMLDHVYHEHRFFYSLESFSWLAMQAGLYVTDAERTPGQGGSLRVTLSADRTLRRAGPPWRLEPPGLCTPHILAGMQARAEYAAGRLVEVLEAERDAGRMVAGYGASAKSATLLNFCGIGPRLVQRVEDLTPGKIGRETPGSRIPIVAPGGPQPDTYLLLAWNYLGPVLRREREFLESGGRLIVPGPVPVVI